MIPEQPHITAEKSSIGQRWDRSFPKSVHPSSMATGRPKGRAQRRNSFVKYNEDSIASTGSTEELSLPMDNSHEVLVSPRRRKTSLSVRNLFREKKANANQQLSASSWHTPRSPVSRLPSLSRSRSKNSLSMSSLPRLRSVQGRLCWVPGSKTPSSPTSSKNQTWGDQGTTASPTFSKNQIWSDQGSGELKKSGSKKHLLSPGRTVKKIPLRPDRITI